MMEYASHPGQLDARLMEQEEEQDRIGEFLDIDPKDWVEPEKFDGDWGV
jgi:hypothetical protein